MSQKQDILNHLRGGGTITSRRAYNEFGITQLGTRIFELRGEGHTIKDRWKSVRSRNGGSTQVKEYYLANPKQGKLFNEPKPKHKGAYSQ